MDASAITTARLHAQRLIRPQATSVKELVEWMGAMQAQDPHWVKWAVGLRLPGIGEKAVDEALDKGEVLRTHAMRPTWHLVSSDDIYWLLDLTAPQIKALLRSRHKELELTPQLLSRTNGIVEKALTDRAFLTREELVARLTDEGINCTENRSSHFLLWAELERLICSGEQQGPKQTYALLARRAKRKETIGRDESVARLAKRYFLSHGPATLKDFVWWSGLSLTEARLGLELCGRQLTCLKINDTDYWMGEHVDLLPADEKATLLLPAFDECIIGYRDRDAIIAAEHHRRVISVNGIFWPTVCSRGKIVATWQRTIKKDNVEVKATPFNKTTQALVAAVKRGARGYARFLGKKPAVGFD